MIGLLAVVGMIGFLIGRVGCSNSINAQNNTSSDVDTSIDIVCRDDYSYDAYDNDYNVDGDANDNANYNCTGPSC